MKSLILILLLFILCACSSTKEKERLFKMFDSKELHADSLKHNIDQTCKIWKRRPWAEKYDDDIFLNYILPPQIANEPIEYYWRTDIPERLSLEYEKETLPEFAERINSMIDIDMGRQNWGNDQMGYTSTMSGMPGKCDDRAVLTAMALRSEGIPAAFETIPIWGGTNNGHTFCGAIMPDSTTYAFQEKNDRCCNVRFVNKVPKIYRLRYFDNTQSLPYQFRKSESLPDLFHDFRLEDVTRYHGIGCKDVTIRADTESGNHICYLSVFLPMGWYPIAYGSLDNGYMSFKDVGTGVGADTKNPLKGKDIGNGILYLPVIYEEEIVPVSCPLIVSHDAIRLLEPSPDKETVTLYRKYPLFERISIFADRMKGGLIEVADNPDFSDAQAVYYVYDTPLSRMQMVSFDKAKTFRYIRFRRAEGALSIAEFQVYDHKGEILRGTPISCGYLDDEPEIANVFDNDPLTYLDVPHGINLWVGIDLGRSVQIKSVGFCPRNDDNGISPGDIYELFWWDNQWKSLGVKRATEYALQYDNVPKNALLWLRNRTRGKEERPFTYENGIQVWW